MLTKKMQNLATMCHVGVSWPTFGILGLPYISGTIEARNFKFGTEMDGSEY